jgi:hypothetical protein
MTRVRRPLLVTLAAGAMSVFACVALPGCSGSSAHDQNSPEAGADFRPPDLLAPTDAVDVAGAAGTTGTAGASGTGGASGAGGGAGAATDASVDVSDGEAG